MLFSMIEHKFGYTDKNGIILTLRQLMYTPFVSV